MNGQEGFFLCSQPVHFPSQARGQKDGDPRVFSEKHRDTSVNEKFVWS